MVVGLELKVEPDILKVANDLIKTDTKLAAALYKALRDTSLEFNKGIKLANPAKTGLSRRAWGFPIATGEGTFVVRNPVSYTPLIKYGKKKPSKYVNAPQGVTITPGKAFIDVANEYFEKVTENFEKKIEDIINGAFK